MNASSALRAPFAVVLALSLLTTLPAFASPTSAGAVFVVGTSADEIDANPGDGVCAGISGDCSLRAAVMEANALPGVDTIRIPGSGPGLPPGPSLSLGGPGEDGSISGDLDILDDLTITGAGMAISGAEASSLGDRALHVHPGVTLALFGVSFFWADAGADQDGGGLLNQGTVTMVEASLQFNRAHNGAGIMNDGTLTLLRSVVGYNTASDAGAGIRNDGTLIIEQSTIASNEVIAGSGGGIDNRGSLAVRNATISQNRASAGAGAIHNAIDGSATINNATIILNAVPSGNPSSPGAGGVVNEGLLRLSNSIVGPNAFGSVYEESDCWGSIESAGYNLVLSLTGCILTGDTTGNLIGVDPGLSPLPTVDPAQTWGYPPLPGSPAIDAGNPDPIGASDKACEPADQAGISRPIGSRCDIGAYESEFGVGEPPTATPTSTETPSPSPTATPTATATPTPTAVPASVLFSDGFESGDLHAWSSSRTDSDDLRVSRAAAIDGNFGLEAVIDDNRALFVVDDTPSGERTYRAKFAFDPSDLSIGRGKAVVLFQAQGGTGLVALRIELRASAGGLQVRAVAPQAGGAAFTTPWRPLDARVHRLEALWWAASSPKAKDGGLEFSVDGDPAGGSSVLRNPGRQVDQIRLGIVTGTTAFTRGACFFDTFVSTHGEPIEPAAPAR